MKPCQSTRKFFNARQALVFATLASASVLIAACGGSSSGGSSPPQKGVAAVGSPLANATITILANKTGNTQGSCTSAGANDVQCTVTADADGNYAWPANITSGPVLIKATSSSTVQGKSFTLYSGNPLAPGQSQVTAGGQTRTLPADAQIERININPLTDVMVTQGMGGKSATAAAFTSGTPMTDTQGQSIGDAVQNLAAQLGALAAAVDLMSAQEFAQSNPFTAAMAADKSSKLDVLLDSFAVRCEPVAAAGSVPANDCGKYNVQAKFPVPSTLSGGASPTSGTGPSNMMNPIAFDGKNGCPSAGTDPTSGMTCAPGGTGSGGGSPTFTAPSSYTDPNTKAAYELFKTALAKMDKTWVLYGCAPATATAGTGGAAGTVTNKFTCMVGTTALAQGFTYYDGTATTPAWSAPTATAPAAGSGMPQFPASGQPGADPSANFCKGGTSGASGGAAGICS